MESLRTKDGRRTAVLVALGIIAALLCAVSFVRNLPALLRPAPIDLAAYYAAARLLNEGRAHELYDLEAQRAAVAGEGLDTVGAGYVYLPFLAVLMRPLGLLSFRAASAAWLIVNVLLLIASTVPLARLAGLPARAGTVLLLFAACLTLPPVTSSLVFGQANVLLLWLLAQAAVHLEAMPVRVRDERLAGLLIGLAAGVKLFPCVAVLPFALRRRWRPVLWTLAGFALTVVVGILAAGGPANVVRYVLEVLPSLLSPLSPMNRSTAAAVQRALCSHVERFTVFSVNNPVSVDAPALVEAPRLAWPITACLSLAVAAVTASALGAARRGGGVAAEMGLTLTAALLVLPLAWDYYHVLLLLPWASWLGSTPNRRQAIPVILVSVLALGVHRF